MIWSLAEFKSFSYWIDLFLFAEISGTFASSGFSIGMSGWASVFTSACCYTFSTSCEWDFSWVLGAGATGSVAGAVSTSAAFDGVASIGSGAGAGLGAALAIGFGAGALTTGLTAALTGAFTYGFILTTDGFLTSGFFTGATALAFGLITSFLGAAAGFGAGAGAAFAASWSFFSFSAYSASY